MLLYVRYRRQSKHADVPINVQIIDDRPVVKKSNCPQTLWRFF
jgi:hypothetical protein